MNLTATVKSDTNKHFKYFRYWCGSYIIDKYIGRHAIHILIDLVSRLGATEGDGCIEMCSQILQLILPPNPIFMEESAFDAIKIYLMVLEDVVSNGSVKPVQELGWNLTLDYLERVPQYYNSNPTYRSWWDTYLRMERTTLVVSEFEMKVISLACCLDIYLKSGENVLPFIFTVP